MEINFIRCSAIFKNVIDVVLFDENQSTRLSICDILLDSGISAVGVSRSSDLISLLRQVSVKLIVFDVMTGCSGLCGKPLIQTVMKISPRTSSLAISSIDNGVDRKFAIASGASAYLEIPFGSDDLISAVKSLVLLHSGFKMLGSNCDYATNSAINDNS